LTVLLATRLAMPVSTTHGLVGALVGAGWAAGSAIDGPHLAGQFFLPLLASPLVAIVLTSLAYAVLHRARLRAGIGEESCFCVGREAIEVVPLLSPALALARVETLSASIGTSVTCHSRYRGNVLGVRAATVLDWLHFLSAGTVGFARGLNDTPKIAALLLIAPQIGKVGGLALVAAVIAVGGLASARRVAETMSQRITTMNHGQGLAANLVTSAVIVAASRFGLPVSTTHVGCGALFGIGAVTGQARWSTIGRILLAWLTTLPAGALLGAASYGLLRLVTF
jgi:PiT family inorganic phosphate transporter